LTNKKPNRTKCREAAFQVLYCQAFAGKDTYTSIAAVETVRTMEDFKAAQAALRETAIATEAAQRALQTTVDALIKASSPDTRAGLKPTEEGTLSTRLHLIRVRREAVEQMRRTIESLQREDPLFASDSYTMRLLENFNKHEEKINSVLSRSLEGWALRRLTSEDSAALRLGITELLYCPDVPAPVIIDEYVELSKSFGDKESPRLVNGVLDRVNKDNRPQEAKPET
jgi:transcription antitermination factor NusB